MKGTTPVIILSIVCLSGCTKSNKTELAVVQATTSSVITSSSFIPHIDTFSGVFLTQVGESGFTSDSTRSSQVYMDHFSDTAFTLSGPAIGLAYYDDMSGRATYNASQLSVTYSVVASGIYISQPADHDFDTVIFRGDSLHLGLQSSPGSCLFTVLQNFNGRR